MARPNRFRRLEEREILGIIGRDFQNFEVNGRKDTLKRVLTMRETREKEESRKKIFREIRNLI